MPDTLPTGEWKLLLPFPPSANHLFGHRIVPAKGNRPAFAKRFPTASYTRWIKRAQVLICRAGLPIMREPVTIELELTAPDKRPRDVDNHSKAVIDALVSTNVLPGDDFKWVKAVRGSWPASPASQTQVCASSFAR